MIQDYNAHEVHLSMNSQKGQIYSDTSKYDGHKRGQSKTGNKRREQKNYDELPYRDVYEEKNNASDDGYVRERMQIEIIPQDDNWGANTTAVTGGDLSDFGDDLTEDGRSVRREDSQNDLGSQWTLKGSAQCCAELRQFLGIYLGSLFALAVGGLSLMTPLVFMGLPRLGVVNAWAVTDCGLECEGALIGIAFKLFLLFGGVWALFAHRPRSVMPRMLELRATLMMLVCLLDLSFWLFYVVRIVFEQVQDYYKILQFTASYLDVLLVAFVVSVFVSQLRPIQPQYVVRVVRSPDGATAEYTLGQLSIQRAAVALLEHYYKDFSVYNPWLEGLHRKKNVETTKKNKNGRMSRQASRTYSHKEGLNNDNFENDDDDAVSMRSKKSTRQQRPDSVVGGNFTANDRFYEEYEHERRLRKRRARLLTTTEDAFTHIRRVYDNGSAGINQFSTVMDPLEAAQAIFSSIARDLRRYLRVTRQQPFFTRDSILTHLANCISYDMSPRSFLQRYLSTEPLLFSGKWDNSGGDRRQSQSSQGLSSHGVNYHLGGGVPRQCWLLICDTPLYQGLEDNVMFVLKQDEVSLMCSFRALPRLRLVEDILDPSRNKFVLRLNSETTV